MSDSARVVAGYLPDAASLLSTSSPAPTAASRAAAIRQQRHVWSTILHWRIQIQPMMTAANRLPPAHTADGDTETAADFERQAALASLDALQAQLTLLTHHTHTQSAGSKQSEAREDDRDMSTTAVSSFASESGLRYAVLDRWLRRTAPLAGSVAVGVEGGGGSSASLLHRSAAEQIGDAVADRLALRRRTQQKRGQYDIVGLNHTYADSADSKRRRGTGQERRRITLDGKLLEGDGAGNDHVSGEVSDSVEGATRVSVSHHVDLFDDVDFYQRLLHDAISGQQQQLQQQYARSLPASSIASAEAARRSVTLAVDRRASKGRKLHFTPIAKLSNFMAPTPATSQPHSRDDAAVDQIVANLFDVAAHRHAVTA